MSDLQMSISDIRRWHHVAITWVSTGLYINDNTLQKSGELRIYIDCSFMGDQTRPRSFQSSTPGGAAQYTCKQSVSGVNQWAFSGIMGGGIKMSSIGEISIGQRMACNATTTEQELEFMRQIELEKNNTFCRCVRA